jgi:hypothetical protein
MLPSQSGQGEETGSERHIGEALEDLKASVDPGKPVSLLHSRNSCAVNKFFRLLADNPLHEKAAGLVVNALKLLHVEELIVRELTVKFERMPVLFGGPGRLILITVRIADAGK